MNRSRINQLIFVTASGMAALVMLINLVGASTQIDIPGPPGSQYFGGSVRVLPNGNLVVCDPGYDSGSIADVGAAYLYDGGSGALISTLTGSTAGDHICNYGITVLTNGNFLIRSPDWDNGELVDVGAVTWGSGTTGITGTISTVNSLVGGSTGDLVSGEGVRELANGNYVILSVYWDNGDAVDAGAVTWGNGSKAITGTVSAANSLVGSQNGDQVGKCGVTALTNSNYVVNSPNWDNGLVADAGAVTWGEGTTGITGPVSPSNSLVGSSAEDGVGSDRAFETSSGDYVVEIPGWDNGAAANAGAVSWISGTRGAHGPIDAENSVRGTTALNGYRLFSMYDPHNHQLVVSRLADNTVTLFRPNRMPIANAGWPQSVERGALVRLDGSASYDPDGNLPLLFTWMQTGGPPETLSDMHAVSPTFTAPDKRTVLTFNLVVTDALGSHSQPSKAIVFVDPYRYFWPLMPEH
jgi:hypothetical protein